MEQEELPCEVDMNNLKNKAEKTVDEENFKNSIEQKKG